MSTKIYVPSYIYNYQKIAEEIEIIKDSGVTILDENQKNDADVVLYKDFYLDLEIHRNLFAYRSPHLIYFNNRFVFNTAVRNFHRRFNMQNVYNTSNMARCVEPKTWYPMNRQQIDLLTSDTSASYRIMSSYEKFEDSRVFTADQLNVAFTDEMLQLNIANRGKMSTRVENSSYTIEKIETLGVPMKTIIGTRDCDNNGTQIGKVYGADYQKNELNFLLAWTNSVGNSDQQHPFVMSYHYDGNQISIVNFRFEINEEIPQLIGLFT